MTAVAIDGPAGAGKSSISRAIAKKLGFIYVDTGALYRTLSLKFVSQGVEAKPSQQTDDLLKTTTVGIEFKNGEQRMMLDGRDVTDLIRTPEVSMAASAVSAVPAVRAYLLDTQRELAAKNNVIMDGRDIGTVVLPDAQIKIFLTASAEDRAKRRYDELVAKGAEVSYDDVLSDMKTRDYNDSHRAVAPLKPAEDSIHVDTSGNTFEQSVQRLETIITERIKEL